MREKIQNILTHLGHGLVERDSVLKATLLAVLAGENVLLVGPPGTGKSMLARRIAQAFGQDTRYFEYLLTKFNTPEELFGPLSLSDLKAGRFKRNTTGYLPTAELAFLDEIFKASSSILNSLLTIMNERVFHNGSELKEVSLRTLIGASNELPKNQGELSALYDRFLVRSHVDYVSSDNLSKLIRTKTQSESPQKFSAFSKKDLEQLHKDIKNVIIPSDIEEILIEIYQNHRSSFKEDLREQLSDRRIMKCLHLLKVSAASNGRKNVDESDVFILKNCLWNYPDNFQKTFEIITKPLLKKSTTQRQFSLFDILPNNYTQPIIIELRKHFETKSDQELLTILKESPVNTIKSIHIKENQEINSGCPILSFTAGSLDGKTVISPSINSKMKIIKIHKKNDMEINLNEAIFTAEVPLEKNEILAEYLKNNVWI